MPPLAEFQLILEMQRERITSNLGSARTGPSACPIMPPYNQDVLPLPESKGRNQQLHSFLGFLSWHIQRKFRGARLVLHLTCIHREIALRWNIEVQAEGFIRWNRDG